MYGTVMRAHVRPENRERFVELMTRYGISMSRVTAARI